MFFTRKINIKIEELGEQNPIKLEIENKKKVDKQDDIYHLINSDHKKKKIDFIN